MTRRIGTPVNTTAKDQDIVRVHPDHAAMTRMLDESPMRPIHYRLWALSTGGTLLSGVSMFMLGVALPLVIPVFHLQAYMIGLIAAMLMAGTVVGALFGGHLADRFGRKPILLLDMALLTIAAVLSTLSANATMLLIFELLVGVGIGMDFPVGSSYVAEFMPQGRRGRMMAASISIQSAGMLLAAAIALVLLTRAQPNDATWRWLLASEAILAMPYMLARFSLPESVRWYMSRGRNAEAARVLALIVPAQAEQLRAMGQGLGTEIHYVAKVPKKTTQLGIEALFSKVYLRRTALVTLPWFLMDIATYGVGLFTAILLGNLHPAGGGTNQIGRDLADALGSGKVDLFLLLGSLIALWAVARFGRIHMQLLGFAGMTLGMGLAFIATTMQGGAMAHVEAIFIGFIIFNLFMSTGPNATTFILPTEMYPTQVRASGAGFAAAIAKIGATLSVFLLPVVEADLGVPMVLILMSVVSLLGLFFTYIFRVQGHGLTLEEHHTRELP
ncbi:MAG: MFS transporter [Acidithiobacillus sp.]